MRSSRGDAHTDRDVEYAAATIGHRIVDCEYTGGQVDKKKQ